MRPDVHYPHPDLSVPEYGLLLSGQIVEYFAVSAGLPSCVKHPFCLSLDAEPCILLTYRQQEHPLHPRSYS